jgi:hypothetical protein
MHLQSEIDHQLFKKHRYAIVDRVAIDDAHEIDFKYEVIAPTFVGRDTERCPLLVDLHALTDEKKIQLLTLTQEQTTQGRPSLLSAFLSSSYEPDKMLAVLQHRITTTLPSGDKGFLRFYDPAIAVHLPRCLDEASLNWFFRKVEALTFFLAEQWCTLSFSAQQERGSEDEWVFGLSSDSIRALTLLSLTNRAREQLVEKLDHPEKWLSVCIEIEKYFDLAHRRFGFTQAEDWIAFSVHGCTWHPHFYEHPVVLEMIQTAGADNTYADQSALLSADQWRQISAELRNR